MCVPLIQEALLIPWEKIDSAPLPDDGGEITLYRRGDAFSIRVDGEELMNSLSHGSEEALAGHALDALGVRAEPRILVGGLGLGFTLSAVLRELPSGARILVAELAEAVVRWNRGPLARLAGHPLEDARVSTRVIDVARLLRAEPETFDLILLDVDNGPRGLTRKANDRLYSAAGLAEAFRALRPRGILALWSAGPDPAFTLRLKKAAFSVKEERVRCRDTGGGMRHTLWIASKGSGKGFSGSIARASKKPDRRRR